MGACYRVKCDGFDPIWVTLKNFEQGEWYNESKWNR
jgi:hypothetical protein